MALCAEHVCARRGLFQQAQKSKSGADLVSKLEEMEKNQVDEFLDHLANFSDAYLDYYIMFKFVEIQQCSNCIGFEFAVAMIGNTTPWFSIMFLLGLGSEDS